MNAYIRIAISLIVINTLVACVSIQPFSSTVRAGDTITLAVGSLDGVTRTNVTLNYFPDSDPLNPIDISANIRSVVKIFPDKTSQSYWDTTTGFGLETISFVERLAGHGAWQTVLVVDLPLTMPAGTGYIQVTMGAGVEYPVTQTRIDDVNVTMEILASGGIPLQGGSHDFEYRKTSNNSDTAIGDITKLEALKQVVVRNPPSTTASYPGIAAAEFDLFVPIVDQSLVDVSSQVSDSDIAIILDDQVNLVQNQTNLIWSRTDSNIKVIILSATGALPPQQIRFSVIISNLSLESSNGWTLGDNVAINALDYYDLNGDPLSGPIPQIIVQ